jgi:catechol 2,3-dioxygenase-like lactoylglutathione lyase family enzyme
MLANARLVTMIPIRNMNRALKFYTKVLGGELVMRGTGEMKNFWAALKLGSSDVWLISPSKREKRTLAYQNLIVKNIKGAVKKLQQHGVKFDKPDRPGPGGHVEGPIVYETFGAAAFFKDTEGNLLMLWQNP